MAENRFELMNRAEAAETIRKLNEEDLRFLNRLIVERLKLISQARSTVMLAHFSVGDRASFSTGAGRPEDRRYRSAQQKDRKHRHRQPATVERSPGIPHRRWS